MLTMFPQFRIGLGVSWLLTAVVAGFMIQAGSAWYWPVLTVTVCGFIALALAELAATSHQRSLLMVLYGEGDPERFISLYEPVLRQKHLPANRALMVRAYLSNAWLALGDDDHALQILKESPLVTGSESANAEAMLAGNRCSIYLQRGNLMAARRELAALKEMQHQDTGAKAEFFDVIPQLEIRCAVLEGNVTPAQVEQMKAIAEATQAPTLRADRELVMAKISILQKHFDTAAVQLKSIAAQNPKLWAVRQAQALLETLPAAC